MKYRRILVEVIAVLYISLMLYTAISKLLDYNLTREQMALMPLLTPVAPFVAWLLPSTEIVIAILIFLPKLRSIGFKFVTILMTLFSVYITYMLVNYEHLPCSCGGLLEVLSWNEHLIFNGAFIILGLIALKFTTKNNDSVVERSLLIQNT